MKKRATAEERRHMALVASLGCIACRQESPLSLAAAELHHVRSRAGAGQRAKHDEVIPLCPDHHRTGGYGIAFHAGPKIWQETYGTEEQLLYHTKLELEQL